MKMKTSEFILFVAASCCPVAFAGDPSVYSPNHACYQSSSTVCNIQTSIRSADFKASNSYFIVPHRGYWGLDPSIPENSVAAMQAAKAKGYNVVELDILRVQDGFVGSHDFVFQRLTNSDSTNWMWEETVSYISSLLLRTRNGSISNYHVMTLANTLSTAKSSNMVVMIDTRPIKAHFVDGKCVELCDHLDGSVRYDTDYMANIRDVIDTASNQGALANLVFKVPYPVDYVKEQVGERFEKVLWMVQVNPTKLGWYLTNHDIKPPEYKVTLNDLISLVNDWNQSVESISAWETAYRTASDMRLQPFSQGGTQYENTLVYINTISNRRAGMFSGEPVGPKGLVNEFADWRANPDPRADHFEIVDYPGTNTMVMTTDRPDFWIQLKNPR